MTNEAFVYCWTNQTNKRLYIGYHKGQTDDGYICSSSSKEFWKDWDNKSNKWTRQIIAHGSALDCRELEYQILSKMDLNECYNNSRGKAPEMTEETKRKMSKTKMGHKTSEETKIKISQSLKGRTFKQLNKETPIACTHCGKQAKASLIKRWHNNNCKVKDK